MIEPVFWSGVQDRGLLDCARSPSFKHFEVDFVTFLCGYFSKAPVPLFTTNKMPKNFLVSLADCHHGDMTVEEILANDGFCCFHATGSITAERSRQTQPSA